MMGHCQHDAATTRVEAGTHPHRLPHTLSHQSSSLLCDIHFCLCQLHDYLTVVKAKGIIITNLCLFNKLMVDVSVV